MPTVASTRESACHLRLRELGLQILDCELARSSDQTVDRYLVFVAFLVLDWAMITIVMVFRG